MTDEIKYDGLLELIPTEHEDNFRATVKLSGKPSIDWIEDFAQACGRTPYCPTVEVRGDRIQFVSSTMSMRRSLDRIKTSIRRTNQHIAIENQTQAVSKPTEDRIAKAEKMKANLKEKGF